MSNIKLVMRFFENQAKLSNDRLLSMNEEQDAALKQKEKLSWVVDKLNTMKGTGPTRGEVDALRAYAAENGVNIDKDLGGLQFFEPPHLKGQPLGGERAWMATPTEGGDAKNIACFDAALKTVDRALNRSADKVTSLNTKAQLYITEAHDAEARVAGLIADYKGLLQELRK